MHFFNRQAFIIHYLRIAANNHLLSEAVSNRHFLYRFASHYLRQDGSLVLQPLESNTNDVLLAEIIASIALELFYERGMRRKRAYDLYGGCDGLFCIRTVFSLPLQEKYR